MLEKEVFAMTDAMANEIVLIDVMSLLPGEKRLTEKLQEMRKL